jgi:hypothetical protein
MYVKRHAVGKVRHKVLRTLGREDELKASGQLDQLAASFTGIARRTQSGVPACRPDSAR